jgi:hypothetical protein
MLAAGRGRDQNVGAWRERQKPSPLLRGKNEAPAPSESPGSARTAEVICIAATAALLRYCAREPEELGALVDVELLAAHAALVHPVKGRL